MSWVMIGPGFYIIETIETIQCSFDRIMRENCMDEAHKDAQKQTHHVYFKSRKRWKSY
jgi:hypothetical protein